MIRIMNDPSDDKITAAYMAGLASGASQNTGGITQTQLNAEKRKTAAAEKLARDADQARRAAEKRATDADQAREAAESKLAGAEKLAMDAERARTNAETRATEAEQAREASESKLVSAEERATTVDEARTAAEKRAATAEQARLAIEKELNTAQRNVDFVQKLEENDVLRNKISVLAAENENLKSRVRGLDSTMKKNEEFIKSQVATINELKKTLRQLRQKLDLRFERISNK